MAKMTGGNKTNGDYTSGGKGGVKKEITFLIKGNKRKGKRTQMYKRSMNKVETNSTKDRRDVNREKGDKIISKGHNRPKRR